MELRRSSMIWKEGWLMKPCHGWQRTTLLMIWMRFSLKSILGLIQMSPIPVMKVEIGRRDEWRRREWFGVLLNMEFARNFAKSVVTCVTLTRLDPFCPAISECSIAEFERNGWSQAYCTDTTNSSCLVTRDGHEELDNSLKGRWTHNISQNTYTVQGPGRARAGWFLLALALAIFRKSSNIDEIKWNNIYLWVIFI